MSTVDGYIRFFESFCGVFVAFFLFRFFAPSYFKQKGKNLADKQDIEDITNKIESVKTDYAKQLNSLDHRISLVNSLFSAHRNEERNSIIAFYESYSYWLYKHFSVDLNVCKYPSKDNLDNILKLSRELIEYHSAVNEKLSKLTLLTQNIEVRQLANKLVVNLIEFHSWTQDKILQLRFKVEKAYSLYQKFEDLNIEINKNLVEMRPIASNIDYLEKECQDLIMFHVTTKIEPFKKCQLDAAEFEFLCRDYLLSTNQQ